jgi:long-chain fatty acid transport protein
MACLCLVPTQAQAAGFFLPGHGIKPMGRGGAFVASGGGDLNSLWHNPANLAGIDELTLTVDLSIIALDFEFARAPRTLDNGDVVTFDPIANEAAPLPNPQILIGGKLPALKDTSWAFGFYAPYTAPQTYPEDGAQRYTLVDNNGSLLGFLHLAIAKEFGDSIRVGAGFQNMVGSFTLVTVSSAYTGLYGDAEDPDQDLLTRITLVDLFCPTGNLGVWVKVAPNVEAAISMQLPVNIRDRDAKLELKLPDDPLFANARVNGDSMDAGLKFPFMARVGLRLVFDKFDYEFAAVYENWGSVKEVRAVPNNVVVEGVPGVGSIEATPSNVPLNYRDTFSLRNGAELRPMPKLALRAGYTFESSAVPDEYYSVFLPDSTKHLITLGGGYTLGKWTIDTGFGYMHMPDRVITNSEVRQINPTDPEGENSTVVGNGSYSQRYIMGGAGLTKRF